MGTSPSPDQAASSQPREQLHYADLVRDVFGNFECPMTFYLDQSDGRHLRMARRLLGAGVLSELIGIFRFRLIVARLEA